MQINNKYIEDFCNDLESKGKSSHTIIAYKKDIEQIASSNIKKSLLEFTTEDLQHALDFYKNNHNFSGKTISRKINSLRNFYTFLLSHKAINSNVALNLTHPKIVLKKQRILKQPEYEALIDSCKTNKRLSMMIELLLNTGIRISELSLIKKSSIDFKSNPAVIELTDEKSKVLRKINISDALKLKLAFYIQTEVSTESEYLFHTRNNKNIQIRNIRNSIDRTIAKAKIKNACVNDLRNTFIVYQLKNSVALEKVAEYVGHKNLSSTQRYLKLIGQKYIPNTVSKISDLV